MHNSTKRTSEQHSFRDFEPHVNLVVWAMEKLGKKENSLRRCALSKPVLAGRLSARLCTSH